MRTMMTITVPVESGNKTIQDGSLPRLVQQTLETLHPEAAYFYADPTTGQRQALVVFDLKEPSDVAGIAEPLFIGLGAAVQMTPVMTAQDLQAALAKVAAR